MHKSALLVEIPIILLNRTAKGQIVLVYMLMMIKANLW